jgi:hypothetical protein
MVAYYGGRAEGRLRRVPVPVVYLDFLSMYPTVNTLVGLWRFLTAARIGVENATDDAREPLAGVTFEGCFDPAFWLRLPVLVLVDPDGDVLPVLRRMPSMELAAAATISGLRLRDLLSGRARPHPGTEAVLTRAAAAFARDRLRRLGLAVPADDLAACGACLDLAPQG